MENKEEIIAETLDVIEDTLDVVENAQKVVKNNPVLIVGAAVLGLGLGAAAGYQFAKKQLSAKYEKIAEREIAEAKEFYSRLNKVEEFDTPLSAAEKLLTREAVEALNVYGGDAPAETEEELIVEEETLEVRGGDVEVAVSTHTNIFSRTIEDFDYDAEVAKRSEDIPYVITFDEYHENDKDYGQVTLTYFKGDDVLADERDMPIDKVDETVGEDNLHRFGHGSKDNNVVYIQNDKLELNFEVLRSEGKYSKEVAGFDEPEDTTVRRFRRSDDG